MSQENENTGASKRKITGYIIQPLMQSKLGLYSIGLSIALVVGIAWILYSNFAELVESVLVLTEAPDEVGRIFAEYWSSTQIWIYLSLLAYVVATIGLSVWYTHKFLGPTVALKKHLEELAKGNYSYRTILRKGDAMEEMAGAMNRVSVVLEREGDEGYPS
ncbi:MAG: hypothetical protein HRU19_18610 [Pseudobacteriovorax sp.]|nr:hypothetical protein [Pseudobacteriovorax sp.]